MAKLFLEATDTSFNVFNNNVSIYGNSGAQTVSVDAGVTGLSVDQSVEGVSFASDSSTYLFKQGGNTVKVYAADGITLVASIPVQSDSDGTVLSFNHGTSLNAKLVSGVMSIGASVLTSTLSSLGTGGTVTGTTGTTGSTIAVSAAGTYALTTAADVVTVSAGNYDATLTGFAVGDKIDLPDAFLSTLTLSNTSATDGTLLLQGNDSNGNVVTLTLTGISTAADASIYSVASFNAAFGSGSLF